MFCKCVPLCVNIIWWCSHVKDDDNYMKVNVPTRTITCDNTVLCDKVSCDNTVLCDKASCDNTVLCDKVPCDKTVLCDKVPCDNTVLCDNIIY